MISYSYALEGETTWLFENNALAVFNKYASWYGTIGTVSAIIIAVSPLNPCPGRLWRTLLLLSALTHG